MSATPEKAPPVLVARIPNNRSGRAALRVLRGGFNRERYRLRVLGSGPRPAGQWSTHLEDANVLRLYVDNPAAVREATELHYIRKDLAASRDAARRLAGELMEAEMAAHVAGEQLEISEGIGRRLSAELVEAREQYGEAEGRAATSRKRCEELAAELGMVPAWVRAVCRFFAELG